MFSLINGDLLFQASLHVFISCPRNDVISLSVQSPPKPPPKLAPKSPPKTRIITKIRIIQPAWKVKVPPPTYKRPKIVSKPFPPMLMQKKPLLFPRNKLLPGVKKMNLKVGNALLPMGKLGAGFVGKGLYPGSINALNYGKSKQFYPLQNYGTQKFNLDPLFLLRMSNMDKLYQSMDYYNNDDWYGKGMHGPIRKRMTRMKPLLPVKLNKPHTFRRGQCMYSDPYLILRLNPHLKRMGLQHIAFEMAHKYSKCY